MKFEKLSGLSAIIAVILAALVFLIITISSYFFVNKIAWNLALICGIGCFIVAYFLIHTGLENFVHAKIKLIYRSINSFKDLDKEHLSGQLDANLDRVRYEVEAWGEAHKVELEDYKKRELFRREFIGNLAHEIKTPIFNIQGYILTLLDGAMDDPKYATRYLERAEKSVERMILLIKDLDEISKLESGFVEIKKAKFNIIDLAKDVVESLQQLTKDREVKIRIVGGTDRTMMVNADASRVRQVIENLLMNAIKYGSQPGEVSVHFNNVHDKVLVEISDDGPGIDPQHLPRLFERFYRVDSSRSREVGGSGLGLAICKHIIEGHKERINVRSKVGEGSVFSFSLQKA